MSGPRPIRWLHLSDLHLGCRGADLWWQVQGELEKSVRTMAVRLGPPDLLIFSGDLTFQGKREEFQGVDRLLDALLGWLREETGRPDPLLVAVPGNHDLQRPSEEDEFHYLILDRYAEAGLEDKHVQRMEEKLWEKRDSSFVKPLFKNYQAWFRRRVLPDLEKRSKAFHLSPFPGDFCLELEIADAFPLCLVGLNSTWISTRVATLSGSSPLPASSSRLPSRRLAEPRRLISSRAIPGPSS